MIANQDAVLGPQGAEAQSERLGVLGSRVLNCAAREKMKEELPYRVGSKWGWILRVSSSPQQPDEEVTRTIVMAGLACRA
jgi:hypothetical protein